MHIIYQWPCNNHACNDPAWYSSIPMHLFFENYMSKKGNWDFLQLVQEKHLYSYLIGWLGSQAGSWGPRKYPSQILSPLVVQQFSKILLTRFKLKARLKSVWAASCLFWNFRKMSGTKLTIARSGESNKCSILYKRQVTHFPLDRVGHLKQWYGVWHGETCEQDIKNRF